MIERDPQSRFRRLAGAGILFQGGAAAVDSRTIIATLVYGLSANTYAVGAVSASLRYGWLFPQIVAAWRAREPLSAALTLRPASAGRPLAAVIGDCCHPSRRNALMTAAVSCDP